MISDVSTFVRSLMQPSSMGYFSLATIGLSRSTVGRGGRAGASREKVSSEAWLTWRRRRGIHYN